MTSVHDLLKLKVDVCGQYLGYDRINKGPLLFLHCYFVYINIRGKFDN